MLKVPGSSAGGGCQFFLQIFPVCIFLRGRMSAQIPGERPVCLFVFFNAVVF